MSNLKVKSLSNKYQRNVYIIGSPQTGKICPPKLLGSTKNRQIRILSNRDEIKTKAQTVISPYYQKRKTVNTKTRKRNILNRIYLVLWENFFIVAAFLISL